MTADAVDTANAPVPLPPPDEGPWTTGRRRRWWTALLFAIVMLAVLGWLLARLVWLPMYMGLFFFLVAGLLVGGMAFRLARAARPMRRGRILRGVAVVALISTTVTTYFEYDYVASSVGELPVFADAKNAAVATGRSAKQVHAEAAAQLKDRLRSLYPPGGVIGYARWATSNVDLQLNVGGFAQKVPIIQGGWRWPARTLVGAFLVALGLWLSFDALRSDKVVTNVLAPGEEYFEDE